MVDPNSHLQLCWASRRNVEQGFSTLLHKHPWWQYLVVLRGKVLVRVGEDFAHLSVGCAAMIPGGALHRYRATADSRLAEVKFYLDDPKLVQPLQDAGPFLLDVGARIPATVDALIAEGVESPPYYAELATHMLFEVLYLHLRQAEVGGPEASVPSKAAVGQGDPSIAYKPSSDQLGRASVARIVAYMEEHLAADLTLGDLAERFGYTRGYLCEMFTAEVNAPPMRYLNLLRLERAKELLATSSLTVSEVAESAGFGSVSQFWRMCRGETGMSPQRFRQQHVGGQTTFIRFMEQWRDFALPAGPR